MPSCRPSEPWTSDNPAYALEAFLNALASGENETVWAFLDENTQQHLVQVATSHTEVFGTSPLSPRSQAVGLLYRVWAPSSITVEAYETVEHTDDYAIVVLHSVFDTETRVRLDRLNDAWRIDLLENGPIEQSLTP